MVGYFIVSKIQMSNTRVLWRYFLWTDRFRTRPTLIRPVINIRSKSSSIRFDWRVSAVRFSQFKILLARQLASEIYVPLCSAKFLHANLHSEKHSIVFHAYSLHAVCNFESCEIGQLCMSRVQLFVGIFAPFCRLTLCLDVLEVLASLG